MSEYSYSNLEYLHPRTIWSLSFQFLYTVLAMIPVYFYFREIIEFTEDAKWLLIFLPVGIGILLFLLQLRLNSYFWKSEKVFRNRDIFVVALKSILLIIISFYFTFLLMFGYWLSGADFYESIKYQSVIGRLMAEVIISLMIVYGLVTMMINVQDSRFEQTLTNRFKRRKR
ncbi:MAG: hypothetical protein ACW98K_11070 [Candidatus Kariarchaeaceae archaeon]